jgi:drug/metabolite transporter (DMT)-like permease
MGFMVAATILLSVLNVAAKALGARYPVTEFVWVRMTVHLLIVIAVAYPRLGLALVRSRATAAQLARSALLVATGLLFFQALRFLSLAEVAAITFSSPLITVLLAGPLLHERVTRGRVAAALIGFIGVVAVIQPFSTSATPAVLLPLAAALTASLYTLLTRRMPMSEAPFTTWFYTAVVGTALLPATAPFGWVLPNAPDALLLASLGVLGSFGHLAIINAYRRAAASLIAPLGYLELIWTATLGLALFAEFPNLLALAGMAAIGIGGAIVARQGRRSQVPLEVQ